MSDGSVLAVCGAGISPRRGYVTCRLPPHETGDHAVTLVSGTTWTWPHNVTRGEPVIKGGRPMNFFERVLYWLGGGLSRVGQALEDRAVLCQRVTPEYRRHHAEAVAAMERQVGAGNVLRTSIAAVPPGDVCPAAPEVKP